VTVSADGGRTYRAISGDRTRPGPLGPAITGNTGGKFRPHVYDLSAYAGKKVLLGFRYVTDGAVNEGGWYLRDIEVGGTRVAAEPARFRSYTQVRPAPVHHWAVRLVGIDGGAFRQVPPEQFRRLRGYPTVIAIVAHDDPTEQVTQYAPYTLTVNGRRLPG